MGQPKLSEDQRLMVVALLANGIRQDNYLYTRRGALGNRLAGTPMLGGAPRQHAPGAYVRGMLDLLAVLFEDGRTVADECYAAARALERGGPAEASADRPDRA